MVAPYFRVFNPVLQAEKFDPKHEHLHRYLGEYEHPMLSDYPPRSHRTSRISHPGVGRLCAVAGHPSGDQAAFGLAGRVGKTPKDPGTSQGPRVLGVT
ncbi:MAG: hypothetical protein JJE28_04185 [Actinomycetales bacterium]|nr:hypothetical protein [Actinomycetales bacterium]